MSIDDALWLDVLYTGCTVGCFLATVLLYVTAFPLTGEDDE